MERQRGDACETFVYFLSACVLMRRIRSYDSLITRLQLKKMSVMYESAHVAITFQLLEMSSITTPNQKQFGIFAQGTFFKGFLGKNISDFTYLHNEKIQSGSYVEMGSFRLLELV